MRREVKQTSLRCTKQEPAGHEAGVRAVESGRVRMQRGETIAEARLSQASAHLRRDQPAKGLANSSTSATTRP